MCAKVLDKLFDKWKKIVFLILYVIYIVLKRGNKRYQHEILDKYSLFQMHYAVKILLHLTHSNNFFHQKHKYFALEILGWQLSNCGFFLENQRQFFHGTK